MKGRPKRSCLLRVNINSEGSFLGYPATGNSLTKEFANFHCVNALLKKRAKTPDSRLIWLTI